MNFIGQIMATATRINDSRGRGTAQKLTEFDPISGKGKIKVTIPVTQHTVRVEYPRCRVVGDFLHFRGTRRKIAS